jgi:hypothetical protein
LVCNRKINLRRSESRVRRWVNKHFDECGGALLDSLTPHEWEEIQAQAAEQLLVESRSRRLDFDFSQWSIG